MQQICELNMLQSIDRYQCELFIAAMLFMHGIAKDKKNRAAMGPARLTGRLYVWGT